MFDESTMEADAAAYVAEHMTPAPADDADDDATVDPDAFKDFKSTGPVARGGVETLALVRGPRRRDAAARRGG